MRRVLASYVLVVTVLASTSACASWTLAPSELDRAGQKVYTQVQIMRLVAEAGLRDRPPTISLQVMVDDAATALSEEELKIQQLGGIGERGEVLLDLVSRAQEEVPSLRSSLDTQDRDGLRQVRGDLEPVAGRLAALGLS